MTRTARRRRGHSGNPQRARAAHDTSEQVTVEAEGTAASDRTSAWHNLLHNRSVRSRVAALVIVPLLGVLVLGALFFRNALDDAASAGQVERLASVGVTATEALHRLQDERDVTGLAEADATGTAAVASARDATDAALGELRSAVDGIRDVGAPVEPALTAFDHEIAELSTYRSQRDESDPAFDAGGADAYHDVAEAIRGIVTASGAVVHDGETARLATGLDNISLAVESASMERALVSYHLSPGDEASTALTAGVMALRSEQDLLIDRFIAGFDPQQAQAYADRIANGDDLTAEMIDQIRAGDATEQTHEQWYASATERLEILREIESEAADAVVEEASGAAGSARIAAIISAVAVLAVLVLTVFLTVAVARSIVGPLRRLRAAAQETAKKDLPAFVERLHRDGPAAAAGMGTSGSDDVIKPEGEDEIGEVAKSFNDVHAMAVQIAGDQALLRQNLDTIVVNLSRRTQSLIDRQLGEIESLEQRERDPDQLSALFRIDHMATRVRRHAESLLVLAGVEEMRKHSSSAPVLDVVRAAAGEVEQYPRVKFGVMPTDLISAAAVDDITHMLAELIDNATEFSAPSTPVRVTSQPLLGGGLRIQVADAGLGIPEDQLQVLNDRLANVGDIDVATSRTLGLYVIARLSAKHGIRVRLEPGSSGGTVAQVDLPANLIHSPLDADVELPGSSSPAAPDPLNTPAPWTAPAVPDAPPARPQAQPTPSLMDDPAPRTPEPEHHEPAPEPAASSADFLSDSAPSRHDTLESTFPSSAQASQESPIFESVRSAWFSSGSNSDWSSPADVGWRRAAEVLRSAEEAANARWNQQPPSPSPAPDRSTSIGSGWAAGLSQSGRSQAGPPQPGIAQPGVSQPSTPQQRPAASVEPTQQPDATGPVQPQGPQVSPSGLPVRRRGASLVPGSISDPTAGGAAPRRTATPAKSADSVSSTLASLQRGVGRGRQETGGWVPKRPSDPERSKQ